MMVIAHVFSKLQTVKILFRALSKKGRFTKRFENQHVKASQILAKSPSEQFYSVFSSFWRKLIWKMSPLVLAEILGVFVDILTAYCKYPVQYCENLQLPIQMQLFEKGKTCSWFFVPFLESPSNLRVNMWKCGKYLWNLHESTFIIVFHHFDRCWFRKCLPYY